MVLLVEDGTGVVGANSYVSLEYADLYFISHSYYADNWDMLDPQQKSNLLVNATTQLDLLFQWYGSRSYLEQELGWPRQNIYIADRAQYLSHLSIPENLKKATCEMAYYLSTGDKFASTGTEELESVKIDVIELKFAGSTTRRPLPAPALILLKGLGEFIYGRGYRKVIVG